MTPALRWKKSSRTNTDECVELALDWKKSSLTESGDCVELALPAQFFAVRDSKHPVPALHFPRPHLATFLAALTDPGQPDRT